MAETNDLWPIEAMWRAADLTRAYLAQDPARVADCLTGLDTEWLERALCWLVLDHDALFDELGEPSLTVRVIDAVAALAPAENEFAATTAVRRVAAKETGLTHAVEGLALLDQIHTIAICTVVMMLEALGHTLAVEQLDARTVDYERRGYPRPYTLS
ncbi:hypothetical protein [Streptomyces sp. NPDC050704]|uniref:hypothetical protein n=1 Tax=Streptomyces sp. NPDC050704 TaxID=3157219 RepID=UPI00341710AB